jgi:hypothetical protein
VGRRRLNTLEVNGVALLHDRKVPGTRANIDHLAVAPSGVWVVDAKNLSGKVEQRNKGGWFTPDRRLYVAGRDRSKLVIGLAWQVDAVRRALGDFRDVPVHPVLCVIADWPLLAEPFVIDGVHVVWPRRLAKMIARGGALENVGGVSDRLASKLPAAS